jgi:hypothetical protein
MEQQEITLKERLKQTTLRNVINSYAPKGKVYEVITNDLLPFTTIVVEPIDNTRDKVNLVFGELGKLDYEFIWETKQSYSLLEEDSNLTDKEVSKFSSLATTFKLPNGYDFYINRHMKDIVMMSVNCYAYGTAKIIVKKNDNSTYSITVTISNLMKDIRTVADFLIKNMPDIFENIVFKEDGYVVIKLTMSDHFYMFKLTDTTESGLMKLKDIR